MFWTIIYYVVCDKPKSDYWGPYFLANLLQSPLYLDLSTTLYNYSLRHFQHTFSWKITLGNQDFKSLLQKFVPLAASLHVACFTDQGQDCQQRENTGQSLGFSDRFTCLKFPQTAY